MDLSNFEIKLIETAVVVFLFFVSRFIILKLFHRFNQKFDFSQLRTKALKKVITFILFIINFVILLIIWGVDQNELFLFISSFLTIMGIAFFAQWSILSNITAGIILYTSHPVRIGDKISILDKDFLIEGEIDNIGIFFIKIKNPENEIITVPNQVIIQKMIKKNNV